MAIVAVFGFWKLCYQYQRPAWLRWLSTLDVLLYGAIGLGLWWLARCLPGPDVLWFVVLGGVKGIGEHLFGIYGLCILEKVPRLQGLDPLRVRVFSFFEYVLYRTLVAWLALGLIELVT